MLKNALDAKLQPKVVIPPPVERPIATTETDQDLLETEDKSRRVQVNQ
jgi:hypothetical protein